MVKCPYCGRLLMRKMPHKCNGNFRKNFHNKKWMKDKEVSNYDNTTAISDNSEKEIDELEKK